tara:strand:- start:661 stop:1161 length:501 start_codon:yes stop_codon:yes gene_type:complete
MAAVVPLVGLTPLGEKEKKQNKEEVCYCHLVQLLRATSHLLNQTYIVHWNLIGSKFYSIHLLTEDIYKEMQDGLDTVAEHIRSLNISTPFCVMDLNEAKELDPLPHDCFAQDKMLSVLASNYNKLAESFSLLSEEAEAIGDQLTMDLAAERGRAHKKQQWLLKSNL